MNLPYGYDKYLKHGVRTLDIQYEHWQEAFETVRMTTKYNQSQIAEKLGVSYGTVHYYFRGERTPKNKEETLEKLKKMVRTPKKLHKTNQRRIYE